jgi:hypothetical protein
MLHSRVISRTFAIPDRRPLRVAALLFCLATLSTLVSAREPASKKVPSPGPSDAPVKTVKVSQPADFKSTHFLLHTDLPSKEAHDLLNRLETMLKLIANYWGHPPLGTIECYVVKDLGCWPEGVLSAQGRAKIQQGAGVTLVETLNRGNQTVAAKAIVYATADHGTPQHEAVHAYCGQTFGKTGPLWYSEGMAEMGQYWRPGDASVRCPDYMIKYIRSVPPKPLAEILAEDGMPRPGKQAAFSGDSWQNYAWRWALCHLLENNPNYAPRFRLLGAGFLIGSHVGFDETFGAMRDEIAFEYRFFLRHMDAGYRVDLCSWDWKRKFNRPSGETPKVARVAANRGWQPTGALVSPDRTYEFSASGTWQLSKGGADLSADGQSDGAGRLEGVILNDFTLGQPFALSSYGKFTPPTEGKLYLRCADKWHELADNKGGMTVKLKLAGVGPKLAKPTGKADEPADDPEPDNATAKAD